MSERYFETAGTPVLAGRSLTWADIFERKPFVMVSASFARKFWGSPASAIGRRLRENPDNPWRTVVGVVGDERDDGVTEDAPPVVYMPLLVAKWQTVAPFGRREVYYAVRTALATSPTLFKQVQQAVWSVNPDLPLSRVRTLDDIRARTMAETRFTLVMLVLASATALLLGAVGLYGVLSYAVAARTREIGVRLALGAQAGYVRHQFVRQGLLLAVAGIVLGLAAAAALSRTLEAFLFGVSPLDPMTYVIVSGILVVVALLASYVPARRASKVDPVIALRSGA